MTGKTMIKNPAKPRLFSRIFTSISITAMLCLATFQDALADGIPQPWEINLQQAASPTMERIHSFHDMMLYIIGGIGLFVLLLLIIIIIRFNSHANPTPSMRAHNTLLEIIWTIVPVVILVVIAVPSMKLLYYTDRVENPDMTLKVTGNQWYWSYEYPDNNDISFSSIMVPDDEIDPSKGQIRLLSTDTPVVLPVDTNIQLLITASDVLHSWAVPAFGVKMDAVPGRLNETWVRIEKPGVYYGQCSELCGKGHAFMPIEVRAVSKDDFKRWVESGG